MEGRVGEKNKEEEEEGEEEKVLTRGRTHLDGVSTSARPAAGPQAPPCCLVVVAPLFLVFVCYQFPSAHQCRGPFAVALNRCSPVPRPLEEPTFIFRFFFDESQRVMQWVTCGCSGNDGRPQKVSPLTGGQKKKFWWTSSQRTVALTSLIVDTRFCPFLEARHLKPTLITSKRWRVVEIIFFCLKRPSAYKETSGAAKRACQID